MEAINNALSRVDGAISVVKTNPYLSGAITLFLILYASLAAPALPASVAGLFEHSVFKLAILTLILMLLRNQDFTTAMFVAIAFVVSLSTLSKYRVFSMASELSVGSRSGSEVSSFLPKSPNKAYGPDGLPTVDPVEESRYTSDGGHHETRLRGHDYAHDDNTNHLPGGHGDLEKNIAEAVQNPMYPVLSGEMALPGYDGHGHASIGGPSSQL